MRLIDIKRRWLRRIVMVTVAPLVTFEYMWIGLKHMRDEFRNCWNFEYEE